MRIAAIDQGTTSTRVLVVTEEGSWHLAHAARHKQHHPGPGRVEHDPEELVANIRACLEAAGPVDAVAIANQGESCVAWDRTTGRAVSPVIVWQDARTAPAIERLKAEGGEVETLGRAGLPLDSYFSAAKLAWILEHVPEARALLKAGTLGLGTTDAFFLDRLAGVYATDATTASRTSLMNLETGRWDQALCGLFGVPIEALAEIRPTLGGFGEIAGIPVTASVVDQQAALYGHGCRKAGDAKITFGTGAFALAVTGEKILRAPERGLLPTVAWREGDTTTYAADGGVYNAGSAVEWVQRLGLFADFQEVGGFDRPSAIERDLAFVPALSGLACPHWDRSAAGLWIGLGLDTDARDLCQAALEGVALRTAEVVRAMDEEVGVGPALSIDGGLSRSAYFVQFLADALGRTIILAELNEITAFGAAGLAARASGLEIAVSHADRREVGPSSDGSAWLPRFGEAVRRSAGWRAVRG